MQTHDVDTVHTPVPATPLGRGKRTRTKPVANLLQSEVTPEVHDLSPDVKTKGEKQAFPLVGLSKSGSVRQEGNNNCNCSVVVVQSNVEKN